MKKFVFIVTDSNRNTLHVGISSNLSKTMDFYRKIPRLTFEANSQLYRLIYFEELNDKDVHQRFNLLSSFTRIQKERIIRAVNPDWIDLIPGLEFERNFYSGAKPLYNSYVTA